MLIGYGGGKEADRVHRQRSLGLKISVAVNITLWEKALPPLCCSQQLGFIIAVHGRLDKA